MHRIDVLQALLERRQQPTYLEIGVRKGHVLFQLRAARKIAVDPVFSISWTKKLRAQLAHASNRSIEYFEETSDEFFENHAAWALRDGVDVAFVDGLHTHEQSYRDVIHCLTYLKPGGAIVMHDCIPPNAAAAQRAHSPEEAAACGHPDWSGEWTGDVFKSVLQLRSERTDVEVFVLNADFGLGIVTRGCPQQTLPMSREEIAALQFEDLVPRKHDWLNVKEPGQFPEWLRKSA